MNYSFFNRRIIVYEEWTCKCFHFSIFLVKLRISWKSLIFLLEVCWLIPLAFSKFIRIEEVFFVNSRCDYEIIFTCLFLVFTWSRTTLELVFVVELGMTGIHWVLKCIVRIALVWFLAPSKELINLEALKYKIGAKVIPEFFDLNGISRGLDFSSFSFFTNAL